jgi:hypothetical protein
MTFVMRTRRSDYRAFASLALLILCFVSGDCIAHAQTADDLEAVAKLYPGIDPQNTYYRPPSITESDYKPYFRSGSSEIVIKPIFTLADGTKTLCQRHPFETAYLYPRTQYTIWLVENWIFQVKKAGRNNAFTDVPGMYVKGLPSYLDDGSKETVIRDVDCNADHEYVFRNIPVGKYVLYIYHVNWVSDFHQRYNTQTIMTPDGPHNEVAPGSSEDLSHVTDCYIDYSQDAVVISSPGIRSTLDPTPFRTVVHFQETHG